MTTLHYAAEAVCTSAPCVFHPPPRNVSPRRPLKRPTFSTWHLFSDVPLRLLRRPPGCNWKMGERKSAACCSVAVSLCCKSLDPWPAVINAALTVSRKEPPCFRIAVFKFSLDFCFLLFFGDDDRLDVFGLMADKLMIDECFCGFFF